VHFIEPQMCTAFMHRKQKHLQHTLKVSLLTTESQIEVHTDRPATQKAHRPYSLSE